MAAPSMAVLQRQKLERIVSDMLDSIDNLRLSITYLMFDLEATKRENQQLKDMLAERT